MSSARLLGKQSLNLGNQRRQVGLVKAHVDRWNGVLLDVRRHMLVMRMRGCQRRLVWVRLGVIPIQLLLTFPDLVAVPVNHCWQPVVEDALTQRQTKALRKEQLPFNTAKVMPRRTKTKFDRRTAGNCSAMV